MNQMAAQSTFAADVRGFDDDCSERLGLYEHAAALVPMGAWSCDLASERLSWTDGVFDIFGLSRDDALDRRATVELFSEESRELLERKRAQAIATRSGFALDAHIVRPDGDERWIRITAATRGSNGRAETLYGMKQDITAERARWDALRAQAEHDPLTGVANRTRFQRFLDQPNDEASAASTDAIILFDMDNFKLINDSWGHAAGDACLVAFAKRLRNAFAHAHLVSRIGGDEFAVLLPQSGSRGEMEYGVDALIGSLLAPVPWQGDFLRLSVSVGLAFASREGTRDPQRLFIAADDSLYSSKHRRRSAPAFAGTRRSA